MLRFNRPAFGSLLIAALFFFGLSQALWADRKVAPQPVSTLRVPLVFPRAIQDQINRGLVNPDDAINIFYMGDNHGLLESLKKSLQQAMVLGMTHLVLMGDLTKTGKELELREVLWNVWNITGFSREQILIVPGNRDLFGNLRIMGKSERAKNLRVMGEYGTVVTGRIDRYAYVQLGKYRLALQHIPTHFPPQEIYPRWKEHWMTALEDDNDPLLWEMIQRNNLRFWKKAFAWGENREPTTRSALKKKNRHLPEGDVVSAAQAHLHYPYAFELTTENGKSVLVFNAGHLNGTNGSSYAQFIPSLKTVIVRDPHDFPNVLGIANLPMPGNEKCENFLAALRDKHPLVRPSTLDRAQIIWFSPRPTKLPFFMNQR